MTRADRLRGYYDRKRETMGARARRAYQEAWVAGAGGRTPGGGRPVCGGGWRPPGSGRPAMRTHGDLARLPVDEEGGHARSPARGPALRRLLRVAARGPRLGVRVAWADLRAVRARGTGAPGASETAAFAGGFRPGDVVVNTFLYHLTPAAHLFDRGLALLGCTVVPTGPGNVEVQVRTILDLGVTGYVGTPSFLLAILKHADEKGLGRLPLQVAQVGAEALPPSLRRAIETDHGILTRQGFGTADLGIIAYECREADGMHVMEDVVLEICDPETGAPLPAGETGEIVCTVNHRAYPMIRFGTGDLSAVTEAPCPCGRTSPRMLGWRGRVDEVTKVRGMFVYPRQADEIVARVPGVSRWQVVVTRDAHQDGLELHVELGARGPRRSRSAPHLVEAIRDVMKLRGEVRVVAPGTIPTGAKKIDDRRTWD